jgi:Zn-dependent protease with chaperone function
MNGVLCVLALLPPLLPGLVLAYALAGPGGYRPALYRTVALSSILSPLPLALCGAGGLGSALTYSLLALAAGYAVLAAIVLALERRVSGSLTVHQGPHRLAARLLDGGRTVAFSVAGFGRVYVSGSLARHLPPHILCSIIAHEHGHLRFFEPLPPQLWYPLSILPAALAFYTVTLEALEHASPESLLWAVLAYAGLAWAWAAYSWAWELYADSFAARVCGADAALEALSLTSAAQPCRRSIWGVVADMVKSLKPVRVVGVSLSNPHPPPCMRMMLALTSSSVQSNGSWPAQSFERS